MADLIQTGFKYLLEFAVIIFIALIVIDIVLKILKVVLPLDIMGGICYFIYQYFPGIYHDYLEGPLTWIMYGVLAYFFILCWNNISKQEEEASKRVEEQRRYRL
ncbi:hypothetical protein [Dialister sp.]|uniref:hypothetical protein n=1 Tax=Dialister sp. TaxID=1955814 RepID=UPI002E802BFF|nr:hypothetical protein [Dialister sp.]MEE3453365.1 hypothetical protein [Dialister sp.]